jgi:hypothetical protein
MAYDNRDPAYVPSQQALAADAYIASTSPETHPDEYTYYPMYGYTYTGPMAHYTSGTEYNTWLNSSLSGSMFGSGQAVADVTNTSPSIPDVDVESLLSAFPNAQDTATYTSQTSFPNLESSSNNLSQVSVADVNALYNELLGRSGAENFLQNWANSGMSLEEIADGIANSPEGIAYAASQSTTPSTTPTTNTPPTTPTTTTPSTTATTTNTNTNSNSSTNSNNNNNASALTAAGLASALSMLIPQPEPPPPNVVGPSSGGTFNPAPIQRLSFSSPQLAPIGSSNQIDYVKQIRAGLFKDLV